MAAPLWLVTHRIYQSGAATEGRPYMGFDGFTRVFTVLTMKGEVIECNPNSVPQAVRFAPQLVKETPRLVKEAARLVMVAARLVKVTARLVREAARAVMEEKLAAQVPAS